MQRASSCAATWLDQSSADGGDSVDGRERHLAGLALRMALPGVPTVVAGDEIGLTGVDGQHARTPFPWHGRDDLRVLHGAPGRVVDGELLLPAGGPAAAAHVLG